MHVDGDRPRKSKNVTEAVMELGKLNKLLEVVEIFSRKHGASRARQQNRARVKKDIWLEKLDVNIIIHGTNWMKERDCRTSVEIVSKKRQ